MPNINFWPQKHATYYHKSSKIELAFDVVDSVERADFVDWAEPGRVAEVGRDAAEVGLDAERELDCGVGDFVGMRSRELVDP